MAIDYFNYFEPFPYDYVYPLLAVTIALICSSICRSHSSAIVLAFFVSLSFTLVFHFCFGEAIISKSMVTTNPYLVEFILIPPIIFNCAFSLDPHDFKKFGWQVLILAVPCFLLSALLFGCLIFVCWFDNLPPGYESLMTVHEAFRLGGGLSTIDPITIGAVIDDLCISHQLTALLKFEALLTQASATIYTDMIALLYDKNEGRIAALVIELAGIIGSIAFGYIYGRATASALANLLYVDYIAECGMVFVMVYLSYATGTLCRSSGTLCVVLFAITFNSYRNSISQRTYDDAVSFWGTVSYFAHAVIVTSVGTWTGMSYHKAIGQGQDKALPPIMLVLFPFSVLCRFVSTVCFTPLLRYAGGFEPNFVGLFVTAGLRGFLSAGPLMARIYDESTTGGGGDKLISSSALLMSVLFVIILSQLIQGLLLEPVAKCLGLRIESRLQPEFFRSLASRVNTHLRIKIGQGKKLPENADVLWDMIEKELTFDFTTVEAGEKNAPKKAGKKDASKKAAMKPHDRHPLSELTEEVEARERLQRCYEAQVRKIWRSYGRTTSVASRVIENIISDAVVSRRHLDVEFLFDSLQPHPIWRRLATWGRKCAKRLHAKRLFDAMSIYQGFWRWRLFMCISTMAMSAFLVYVSLTREETNTEPTNDQIFVTTLLSMMVSLEQAIRLVRLVKRFRGPQFQGRLFTQPWFWYELGLTIVQVASDAIHMAIIMGDCVEKDIGHVHWSLKPFCEQVRIAMLVTDLLPLLQLPMLICLLLRLAFSEVEVFVLTRDEETFEAVTSLLTVTDTVLRLLAGRSLVQKPSLQKKLSEECLITKTVLEDKLVELLNRQGGTETLANIKTRQAAREVIEEVASLLVQAKASGSLREFEYACMEGVVNEMRSNVQMMGEDRSVEIITKPDSTNDAAMDILTHQFRHMEWMHAAGSHAEITKIVDRLKAKGRLHKFNKKDIIISDGQTVKEAGVYLLLNGFCRGIMYDYATDELKKRLIHAGTMFGENGLMDDPYTETVVVANPSALVFWLSARTINGLPPAVHEAFNKQLVEKACIDYLRREERYHAWSDEMLHQYVRRVLKSTTAGAIVPEEFQALILFKGTLLDANGKVFAATPYRPIKLGTSVDQSFQEPLQALPKGGVAYYVVSRSEAGFSLTVDENEDLGESFMMVELDSDMSVRSAESKSAPAKYKKFKPLYTKMKGKKED